MSTATSHTPNVPVYRSQYPEVGEDGQDISAKWSCKLEVLWSVPTGQCVDASPLVIQKEGAGQGVAYIGSHSGLFIAVEIASGSVLWKTDLGGRVESSACASQSGSHVSVGRFGHTTTPNLTSSLFPILAGSSAFCSYSPRLLQWVSVHLVCRHRRDILVHVHLCLL